MTASVTKITTLVEMFVTGASSVSRRSAPQFLSGEADRAAEPGLDR
jgi:hypothetical protein